MKVSIKKTKQSENTLVAFMFKDHFPKALNSYKKEIEKDFKELDFKGEPKTCLFLPLAPSQSHKYLMILGLGAEKAFHYEKVRQASARMYKELKKHKQKKADVLVESFISQNTKEVTELCKAFTTSVILSSYTCNEFKKKESKEDKEVKELFICLSHQKKALLVKRLLKKERF